MYLSPDRPAQPPSSADAGSDFAAALLPQDSWAPDEAAGDFEVDSAESLRWTKKTRTARRSNEYMVK
ncbi:hypothetical protein PybrP1_000222 [[Pythium] brassicae (nom. inval.)]|nr:hypothetical protein PybrP1_000222 [[Pythium] brassicae (nom. inval.)]